MRCVCCDRPMDDPKIDHRDGEYRPCSTCEEIIYETAFGEFDDEDDEELDEEYDDTIGY